MGVAVACETAEVRVTVGVDTHAHVATAVDQHGRLLDTISVPTTEAGHARLMTWACGLGVVDLVGIEGTGSYGAGLTRHLHEAGVQVVQVVEVVRPNRQTRRRHGNDLVRDRGLGTRW